MCSASHFESTSSLHPRVPSTRRDQREIRSQVPGVRLHGIDEARLVLVFFGRSKSILMHSGDGDADRVYDVAGLPCMFRFSCICLCLLRDTRRHYGELCGGEKTAVKRQGVEGVGGVGCNHRATEHSGMSCSCRQNEAEAWKHSPRQVPMLRQVRSTAEVPSCLLLRSSSLL